MSAMVRDIPHLLSIMLGDFPLQQKREAFKTLKITSWMVIPYCPFLLILVIVKKKKKSKVETQY